MQELLQASFMSKTYISYSLGKMLKLLTVPSFPAECVPPSHIPPVEPAAEGLRLPRPGELPELPAQHGGEHGHGRGGQVEIKPKLIYCIKHY